MSRTVLAIATAALLAIAGLLIASRDAPVSPATAAARSACKSSARFERTVQANGAAEDAQRQLAEAIARARRAVALDRTWTPLQSGLETIELALEKDDAGTANVGLRVLHAQCDAAERAR